MGRATGTAVLESEEQADNIVDGLGQFAAWRPIGHLREPRLRGRRRRRGGKILGCGWGSPDVAAKRPLTR